MTLKDLKRKEEGKTPWTDRGKRLSKGRGWAGGG